MLDQDVTRPPLEVLRYVDPNDITVDHLANFVKLEQTTWDGTQAEDWLSDIKIGASFLWECEGADAVVITRVVARGQTRELSVDGVAGRGIMAHAGAVARDLLVIAGQYNCQFVGGDAIPMGLRRLYDHMGMRAVSVHYVMETANGQP